MNRKTIGALAAALILATSFASVASAQSYQVPAQLLGSETGSAPDYSGNTPQHLIIGPRGL